MSGLDKAVTVPDFAFAPENEISVSRASLTLGLTTVSTSVFPWIDADPVVPKTLRACRRGHIESQAR